MRDQARRPERDGRDKFLHVTLLVRDRRYAGSFNRRNPRCRRVKPASSIRRSRIRLTTDRRSRSLAARSTSRAMTGRTWFRRDYPGPAGKGTAIFIPDADTVIVGLNDGRMCRTHWSSFTGWSQLSPLATPRAGAVISDLHVHGESIWATSAKVGGGRVFHSGDGGNTWHDRTGGLPDIAVNSIAIDLRHPRMWVGTDCGVWESRDHGATWTPFATNLPNVMVSQDRIPRAHGPAARRNAQPGSLGSRRGWLTHRLAPRSLFPYSSRIADCASNFSRTEPRSFRRRDIRLFVANAFSKCVVPVHEIRLTCRNFWDHRTGYDFARRSR